MFTVCPKCALTLVVTAADLRVAQGYVRCGRCSNVFNALSRLSEDRQAAAAQTQAPPDTTSTTQQRTDTSGPSRKAQDLSATASLRKAPDPAASAKLRQPSAVAAPAPKAPPPSPPTEPKRYGDDSILEEDLEFNPAATDLNKVFVEQPPSPQFAAATGTFQALRLEAENAARSTGDTEPASEPFDPTDSQVDVDIDPDLLASMAHLGAASESQREVERAKPTIRESVPRPKARPSQTQAAPPAPARHEIAPQPLEQPPAEPSMRLAERAKARAQANASPAETTNAIREALLPRRRAHTADATATPSAEPTSFFAGMWTTGCIVLLLLLIIQVVHHYRHDLAANPTLNGPITAIYAVLGIPVMPRWDPGAYEVRQLGASTSADTPGQITVRASVKNGARQAQPLPLLRVTLQDRFGNRIAARDVPPQSYLPRAIPSSSLLSAGQRIDAEMTFVDPGSNAVGFEIDACLPAPEGAIACANDSLGTR